MAILHDRPFQILLDSSVLQAFGIITIHNIDIQKLETIPSPEKAWLCKCVSFHIHITTILGGWDRDKNTHSKVDQDIMENVKKCKKPSSHFKEIL